MGQQNWVDPLTVAVSDGPTLTAAGATSCFPGPASSPKITLGTPFFYVGKILRLTASGRISCAVSSPGTARFDLRLGNTVVFDTQAMALNTAGKTNVGWWLQVLLTCRTVGSGISATLFGLGTWTSEAGVGAPAATAGGNAVFTVPYNAVPVAGNGFDSTVAQAVDFFFTQTVGTGSMTLHQFLLEGVG